MEKNKFFYKYLPFHKACSINNKQYKSATQQKSHRYSGVRFKNIQLTSQNTIVSIIIPVKSLQRTILLITFKKLQHMTFALSGLKINSFTYKHQFFK